MEADYSNLHVVVTGGTGALGAAVVERLLKAGARCSIPCFDESELRSFDYKNHDRIFIKLNIDLTDEEATQNFYEAAVNEQGELWASIHIAGGFGMGKIGDSPKADFMKQVNLNVLTCYNCCRTAISYFRKRETTRGRIVNIASRPALEPRQGAGMTAYTSSKAAVAALTQSLAAEVVQENILVNAIAPSVIDTEANRQSMPDANFEKWPKPTELATQIEYLISPDNTITRGAVIPVYGKS